MKKFILFFFILFIAPAVFSADELKREELVSMVQEMVKAKIASRMITRLETNQMSSEEIQEVITSPEFKKFTQRVVAHPKVTRAINEFVDRMNRKSEPPVTERVLTNAMLKDYQLNAAASRVGEEKKKPKGALQSFWERAKRFLFEG